MGVIMDLDVASCVSVHMPSVCITDLFAEGPDLTQYTRPGRDRQTFCTIDPLWFSLTPHRPPMGSLMPHRPPSS
ncbi:hypothetical protein T10_6454 [Trichinella papuae]|uniref:Uncharacterized protein n=1 Tax=Trichinella papuae TaxID=268474 RepID=A0A0V1MK54_9BILA|nr:hypothetical protein T10_6454 [Trichinella papuae]